MKYSSLCISVLVAIILLSSASVSAQTTGTSVYNPVSSSDTKKTFSGTSFSSVGGAVAGCANVGGIITNGAAKLFNKYAGKTGSDKVPVDDPILNRRENCLNGVAYSIAKNLLQQVSTKALNWINKGLGGNPLYVQDVSSNLRTIRDQQLGRYLDKVQTSNPVFGNAIRSAVTKQVTGITDGYINKSMNTPQAKQYEAFQKDFTKGGWGALLNMNNNPVGALFNSTDTVTQEIASVQEERVNEIQRNDGFLDMRSCVEYAPVKFAGSPICNDNGIPLDELPPGTECLSGTTPAPGPGTEGPECLRYKTVTPGALISQQANNILGTPTRQLEMADSINEVLGSFFDQLLNKLYQKGLAAFQTRTNGTSSNGSFGNNVVLGTNGLPINTNGGNAFGYQTVGTGYDVQDFDISRPQQLYAIIKAQYDFKNRSSDSQIAMASIVPTLGALDYCIPGPNPSWREGLSENYDIFIGSFETPTTERTFLGKFFGAATSSTIQALVGLFGGGGSNKELVNTLIAEPILFDKTTSDQQPISPWSYVYFTSDYSRGVKNTDGDTIRSGYINPGYERIIPKYEANFTQTNIVNLFTATSSDPVYAAATIKNAIAETAKLISYNQSLAELNQEYDQGISDTQDALDELEAIRKETNLIVKTAKARYIAERAALGNPVDMSCINGAYVINDNPITGVARQESDTPKPIIQQSKAANDYFYTTL